MKSYTDLKQSKTLAKILPLESVDMNYWCGTQIRIGGHRTMDKDLDVPCWSLAALLNIIPQEIFDGEYIINITEGINNRWVITYDHNENRNHSYYGLSTSADNLVDACTDIIIKLKERNII